MTYKEIRDICLRGKIGLVPGWTGYIKYDYCKNELYFQNEDCRIEQSELEDKIKNRNDLYYII